MTWSLGDSEFIFATTLLSVTKHKSYSNVYQLRVSIQTLQLFDLDVYIRMCSNRKKSVFVAALFCVKISIHTFFLKFIVLSVIHFETARLHLFTTQTHKEISCSHERSKVDASVRHTHLAMSDAKGYLIIMMCCSLYLVHMRLCLFEAIRSNG